MAISVPVRFAIKQNWNGDQRISVVCDAESLFDQHSDVLKHMKHHGGKGKMERNLKGAVHLYVQIQIRGGKDHAEPHQKHIA